MHERGSGTEVSQVVWCTLSPSIGGANKRTFVVVSVRGREAGGKEAGGANATGDEHSTDQVDATLRTYTYTLYIHTCPMTKMSSHTLPGSVIARGIQGVRPSWDCRRTRSTSRWFHCRAWKVRQQRGGSMAIVRVEVGCSVWPAEPQMSIRMQRTDTL